MHVSHGFWGMRGREIRRRVIPPRKRITKAAQAQAKDQEYSYWIQIVSLLSIIRFTDCRMTSTEIIIQRPEIKSDGESH